MFRSLSPPLSAALSSRRPSRPLLGRLLPFLLVLSVWLSLSPAAAATRIIQSTSLNPCMKDSLFSATLFNITFTPDDGLLRIRVNGISSLSGKVTAKLAIIAYGYTAMEKDLDPCTMAGFEGMCPMSTGQITLNSQIDVGSGVANTVPGTCAIHSRRPRGRGLGGVRECERGRERGRVRECGVRVREAVRAREWESVS